MSRDLAKSGVRAASCLWKAVQLKQYRDPVSLSQFALWSLIFGLYSEPVGGCGALGEAVTEGLSLPLSY